MTDTKSSDNNGRISAARAAIGETAHNARDAMEQSYRKARGKASAAYAGTVESAEHAVKATKRGARKAAHKTATTVDTAPLAVLAGGLAVGAIAGGLLPRTTRETATFGKVGKRVTGTATAAALAARSAGQDQLKAAGFSRDSAKSQLQMVAEVIIKALAEAGTAAGAEVKRGPKA